MVSTSVCGTESGGSNPLGQAMRMNDRLKAKYTTFNEPDNWKNVAGKKNVTQYGRKASGNSGVAKFKNKDKPLGFSGATAGKLLRRFSKDAHKKK